MSMSRDGHVVTYKDEKISVWVCLKEMTARQISHMWGADETFELELNERGLVQAAVKPGYFEHTPEWLQIAYQDYVVEKELGLHKE